VEAAISPADNGLLLLADDHPTLWLGPQVLLERAPDVEVVGEAEDGEEALALIEALVPDVAVLECKLPVLEGTEVAQEIRRRDLPVQVLALSAYGEGYFSPPVAAKVAAWTRGERPGGLTEREVEVLRLVAKGLSNKEIAQTLSITVRTVDFHISNILKKLEVTSRVEAAVWAKEQGVAS